MSNAFVRCLLALAFVVAVHAKPATAAEAGASLDVLIAQHAGANGVPVSPRHHAREPL
jgi:hypothetical protein